MRATAVPISVCAMPRPLTMLLAVSGEYFALRTLRSTKLRSSRPPPRRTRSAMIRLVIGLGLGGGTALALPAVAFALLAVRRTKAPASPNFLSRAPALEAPILETIPPLAITPSPARRLIAGDRLLFAAEIDRDDVRAVLILGNVRIFLAFR